MKTKPIQLSQNEIRAIRSAEASVDDINMRAAVRDLFALGLFLRLLGYVPEGYKACSHALRTLSLADHVSDRILKNLDGNEKYLATIFQSHSEFRELIKSRSMQAGIPIQ